MTVTLEQLAQLRRTQLDLRDAYNMRPTRPMGDYTAEEGVQHDLETQRLLMLTAKALTAYEEAMKEYLSQQAAA